MCVIRILCKLGTPGKNEVATVGVFRGKHMLNLLYFQGLPHSQLLRKDVQTLWGSERSISRSLVLSGFSRSLVLSGVDQTTCWRSVCLSCDLSL